jgi:hypothetical protein
MAFLLLLLLECVSSARKHKQTKILSKNIKATTQIFQLCPWSEKESKPK